MGRACGLLMIAAFAGCGAARGDTSARASADGGLERGRVDGGSRAPERDRPTVAPPPSPAVDQCRVDADCVATAYAGGCCPTECALYVASRTRAAEYERACAGIACPRRLVCREPPRRVVPACLAGGCVDRASRRRDRCERDDECVQSTRDPACCHTCGARVVTRLRFADEEARCAAPPSPGKCFEGDCHPPTVQPACVRHRCVEKPR